MFISAPPVVTSCAMLVQQASYRLGFRSGAQEGKVSVPLNAIGYWVAGGAQPQCRFGTLMAATIAAKESPFRPELEGVGGASKEKNAPPLDGKCA